MLFFTDELVGLLGKNESNLCVGPSVKSSVGPIVGEGGISEVVGFFVGGGDGDLVGLEEGRLVGASEITGEREGDSVGNLVGSRKSNSSSVNESLDSIDNVGLFVGFEVGLGGRRTASMTWIIPLQASMSGMITLESLILTPSSTLTVTEAPLSVSTSPLTRDVLGASAATTW